MHFKKNEVAKLLGVHRNTVTNLMKSGELKGMEICDLLEYARLQGKTQAVEEMVNKLRGR